MSKRNYGITLIHYVFTTKYREAFFDDEQKRARVRGIIAGAAVRQGCTVHAIACVYDHVHVMLELPRTKTVSIIAQEMKRQSSVLMRKMYPDMRPTKGAKQDHLWGRRYSHSSVSGDFETVKAYIDNQLRGLGVK